MGTQGHQGSKAPERLRWASSPQAATQVPRESLASQVRLGKVEAEAAASAVELRAA